MMRFINTSHIYISHTLVSALNTDLIECAKNIINLHSLLIGAGLVDYRLALMHHDKAVSVFNSVAQIVCDHDCCDLLLCHNLACVAIAIKLGMPSSDLKLITAVLFLIILVLGMDRNKRKKVA